MNALAPIIEQLKKEDNLSTQEILKMDMLDYNRQLVVRAQKRLKEQQLK